MMKDANVNVRVEPDVKAAAENILKEIGIPVSVAIDSLYRQIIFHRGIPFPLTAPTEDELFDGMSAKELEAVLRAGYEQSLAGEGRPYEEVFAELEGHRER